MRDQARNIVHGAIQQMFSNDNSLFGKAAHIAFIKMFFRSMGTPRGARTLLSASPLHGFAVISTLRARVPALPSIS